MKKQLSSSSSLSLVLLLLLLVSSFMANKGSGKDAAVHIVYTERPEGEEPEAYHVRTLTSVLRSEEAGKESLIYSYKNVANGFSAKLTPEQVVEISST